MNENTRRQGEPRRAFWASIREEEVRNSSVAAHFCGHKSGVTYYYDPKNQLISVSQIRRTNSPEFWLNGLVVSVLPLMVNIHPVLILPQMIVASGHPRGCEQPPKCDRSRVGWTFSSFVKSY